MFEVTVERTSTGAVARIAAHPPAAGSPSGRVPQAEALRFAADVEDLSGGRRWLVSVECLTALSSEVRVTLADGPRGSDTVEEAERTLRVVELERARAAFFASRAEQAGQALRRLEAAALAAYRELPGLGAAGG